MLMPRRAAIVPALPDGAPYKVASPASAGWFAAFEAVLNGNRPVRSDDDGNNSLAVALRCGRLEPENARAPFFAAVPMGAVPMHALSSGIDTISAIGVGTEVVVRGSKWRD